MIPYTSNGFYSKLEPTYVNVSESTEYMDGEAVTITCFPGFNMKGPSRMECRKGDWDVGIAMPECTPGYTKHILLLYVRDGLTDLGLVGKQAYTMALESYELKRETQAFRFGTPRQSAPAKILHNVIN